MYKDYSTEDYLKVADESSARIRNMLEIRFHELEELREAINDHYSSDDLFLKWAEVDNEEKMIKNLLICLEKCTESIKEDIKRPGKG